MFTYLFGISRRWEMIFLLCSGIMIVYTLRVNMSVAAPKMKDSLNWSELEKGYVLSSFYWGYALGQIPASRYTQIYGAKWLFGLSILIPSILTLFVPIASITSLYLTYFIRFLIGFCESASFPSVFYFFPYWIPLTGSKSIEKTLMITATMSGIYIGEMIGFSMSGYLVDLPDYNVHSLNISGWPSVFYIFGLLGICWYPLWWIYAYESPELHPYMTKDELLFIRGKGLYQAINNTAYDNIDNPIINNNDEKLQYSDEKSIELESNHISIHRKSYESINVIDKDDYNNKLDIANRTPWKKFFTNKVSLTYFVASWVFGFIGFMLLSEMPSYLTEVLNFDLKSAGLLCIAPYAGMFIMSLGFGFLFDYMQQHYNWSNRFVRQVAQFVAFGGSGGMLIICGYTDAKYIAYVFMVLGQALLGVSQCGLACVYIEVSPRYSSFMNTIGNTIGAVAGIVGPIIVASFTSTWPGKTGWECVFLLTGAMCTISLILWTLFQTSDIVDELNTPT